MKYVCERFLACSFRDQCRLGTPFNWNRGRATIRSGMRCRLSAYDNMDAVIQDLTINPKEVFERDGPRVNIVEVDDDECVED